jgi:hypothetical protein
MLTSLLSLYANDQELDETGNPKNIQVDSSVFKLLQFCLIHYEANN